MKPIMRDERMLKRMSGKTDKARVKSVQEIVAHARHRRPSHITHRVYRDGQQTLPYEVTSTKSDHYPAIRQVKFEMALSDKEGNMVHSYTSIQSQTASAPRTLEEEVDWRVRYPGLVSLCEEGPWDCPIFLLDASLSLTAPILPGSMLSIDIALIISQGADFRDWKSFTRFYQDNGQGVDLEEFYAERNRNVEERQRVVEDPWRDLDCRSDLGADVEVSQIPLKSAWWVRAFSDFISVTKQAKASQNDRNVRSTEEGIDRSIRGISVLQEIWATAEAPQSGPQRLVVLAWKFSRAKRGQVGTTSWRRLMQTTNPFGIQSPTPPLLHTPLTLNTTLHEAMNRRLHKQDVDYYSPRPSIFVDNAQDVIAASLSEGSSLATTPSMDYASFESSTSTSFPSTLPCAGYTPNLGQDSSFQSQNPLYMQGGSFDLQDPPFQFQDSFTHSHDVYDFQSQAHHSQDDLYQDDNDLQYDWTACQPSAPDDLTPNHDFTGGKIQIAYPPNNDPFDAYDAPLIAPRANALPQHSLLQDPEQFNHEDYLEPERDQQHVDWELIASQPLQVAGLRFHPESCGDLQQLEHVQEQAPIFEELAESQGQVLGKMREGESQMEGSLESYH